MKDPPILEQGIPEGYGRQWMFYTAAQRTEFWWLFENCLSFLILLNNCYKFFFGFLLIGLYSGSVVVAYRKERSYLEGLLEKGESTLYKLIWGCQKYGENICQKYLATLAMSTHVTLRTVHTKGSLKINVLRTWSQTA